MYKFQIIFNKLLYVIVIIIFMVTSRNGKHQTSDSIMYSSHSQTIYEGCYSTTRYYNFVSTKILPTSRLLLALNKKLLSCISFIVIRIVRFWTYNKWHITPLCSETEFNITLKYSVLYGCWRALIIFAA